MFKKSIDQEVLAQGRAHVDTRSPTVTRKDKAAVVMKPWQKFPGETQEQAMLRKVSEQLGHGDMHEEEMFESTPTEAQNVREKGGAKPGKDADKNLERKRSTLAEQDIDYPDIYKSDDPQFEGFTQRQLASRGGICST